MKFAEYLTLYFLVACASCAPTPTSSTSLSSSTSKPVISSTSRASAVHPTIIISTASHPTTISTATHPTTTSIHTTLKHAVASDTAANIASPNSKTSSSGNSPLSPLVQAAQLFNIQTFREGVPYLHKRQVQLTPSNELVINAEQGTGSGVIPFVGYLSDMRTLVATRDDSNTKANVAVYPDGSLKLWLNSLITVPDNTEEPVNSTGIIMADGTEVGPWTITTKRFLTLNSNNNAWSCPEGKSGVYRIFWTEDRPTGKFGCLKVDLYVPGDVTSVLQKRVVVPEDVLEESSLRRRFWDFIARY